MNMLHVRSFFHSFCKNSGFGRRIRRSSTSTSESSISAHQMVQRAIEDPQLLENFLQKLPKEHRRVLSRQIEASSAAVVPEPPVHELRILAFSTSIPFVGFGIMDNAILIIAGDAIDTSLGVALGISTMCAAAIGNIISDVAGIALGTVIEDFCANVLKLPVPKLTAAQRNLRSARFANQFGCAVGIVIGCIIGMFPLLFYDSNKLQARKRQAAMDNMFRDVVKDAGSLIGAQRTTLFLIVDGQPGKDPAPTPDGRFLFAKYENNSKLIPLGKGLISRAALTGESWNIYDVHSEPEYSPAYVLGNKDDVRNMLCVPVVDNNGRPIAVLQAINKKIPDGKTGKKRKKSSGFSSADVQTLKALASHISVSLQRMNEGENGDMQMKDTIRMLRDYGLEGIPTEQSAVERTPLFAD